jgi:hypothetical protein
MLTLKSPANMIGISSQPLLATNLNILHTFGEYPAKLENIKVFYCHWEYLEIRTQSPPALFVQLQDTLLHRRLYMDLKQVI